MQSILLTTPSKDAKLEISHENKLSNDGKTTQDKQASEKKATEFASILDNTLEENKGPKNKKAQNDTLSDSLPTKNTAESAESKTTEGKAAQNKEVDATKGEGKQVPVQQAEDKALSPKEKSVLNTDAVVTEKNIDIKGEGNLPSKEQAAKEPLNPQATAHNNTSENMATPLKAVTAESVKQSIPVASEVTEAPLTSSPGTENKTELNSAQSLASEHETSKVALQTNNTEENKASLEKGQSTPTSADVNAEKITQVATEEDTVAENNVSTQTQVKTDKLASQDVDQKQVLSTKELDKNESLGTDKNIKIADESTLSAANVSQDKVSEGEVSEDKLALENNRLDSQVNTDSGRNKESHVELVAGEEKQSVLENQNPSTAHSEIKVSKEKEASVAPEELEAQKLTTDFENSVKAETLTKGNTNSPTTLSEKSNKDIDDNEESTISSVRSDNEDLSAQLDTQTPEQLISHLATSIETASVEKATQPQVNAPEATENEMEAIDESIDSEMNIDELAINPILAQIQTAQKTDTKVSDNQLQMAGINGIDKDNKKSDKSSLKELGKESIKLNKTNVENVLAEASVESDLTEKQLISKANVANNEKLEGMLANFRAEANKPFFNQHTEANAIATPGIASASADKLLHQTQVTNTQSVLQSSALQQPLELQAKHAANMVGERIMMMLNQGKQEVTIRLDPAELGSMHIKLQVQQDQLQVAIHTQVGQSRDIIEQNLPRLREQLAQQGINLGETSVQQQSQQSQQNQSNSQGSSQAGNHSQGLSHQGDDLVEDNAQFIPTQIPLAAQGIDYYA